MFVLLMIFAVVLVICLFLLFRNEEVCKFRLSLIDQVSQACQRDIENDKYDYSWRWNDFNSVPYEKNLFSVKSLKVENFWSDTSFLK